MPICTDEFQNELRNHPDGTQVFCVDEPITISQLAQQFGISVDALGVANRVLGEMSSSANVPINNYYFIPPQNATVGTTPGSSTPTLITPIISSDDPNAPELQDGEIITGQDGDGFVIWNPQTQTYRSTREPEPVANNELVDTVYLDALPTLNRLDSTDALLREYWITVIRQSPESFNRSTAEEYFVDEMSRFLVDVRNEIYQMVDGQQSQFDVTTYENLSPEQMQAFLNPSGWDEGPAALSRAIETGINPQDVAMRGFTDEFTFEELMAFSQGLFNLVGQEGISLDYAGSEYDISVLQDSISSYELFSQYAMASEWINAPDGEKPFNLAEFDPDLVTDMAMYGEAWKRSEYVDDPEFWLDLAYNLQRDILAEGDLVNFNLQNLPVSIQELLDPRYEEMYGTMGPSTARLLAEAFVQSELGAGWENLNAEEITQYIVDSAEGNPDAAAFYSSDTLRSVGDAKTFLEARAIDRQRLSFEKLEEFRGLVAQIEALPDEILGVPTGLVKAEFSGLLSVFESGRPSVEDENQQLGDAEREAIEASVMMDEKMAELNRNLIEGGFTLASLFALGSGLEIQIGLALLEGGLTKNPLPIIAEMLPFGLEGLGKAFHYADDAAVVADDIAEFAEINARLSRDARLADLSLQQAREQASHLTFEGGLYHTLFPNSELQEQFLPYTSRRGIMVAEDNFYPVFMPVDATGIATRPEQLTTSRYLMHLSEKFDIPMSTFDERRLLYDVDALEVWYRENPHMKEAYEAILRGRHGCSAFCTLEVMRRSEGLPPLSGQELYEELTAIGRWVSTGEKNDLFQSGLNFNDIQEYFKDQGIKVPNIDIDPDTLFDTIGHDENAIHIVGLRSGEVKHANVILGVTNTDFSAINELGITKLDGSAYSAAEDAYIIYDPNATAWTIVPASDYHEAIVFSEGAIRFDIGGRVER